MAEREIATDETSDLIASNKVEGTAVFNEEGDRLGNVYNFMVDKRTGEVEYAVLQFGGLFGIGSKYYPLPWSLLEYDEGQGGYVVDIDKEQLEAAPSYAADTEPRFDRTYGETVYSYYGLAYPMI